MKKNISTKICIGILLIMSNTFSNKVFSQTQGAGIFFQAVARDNFSNPAKDRKIYIQSTIIQNTENGTKVLIEEHQSQTDPTGVFSISIGQGTRKGGTAPNLGSIEWVKGPYFLNLKIAIQPIAPVVNWDYTKELIDLGTTPFGTVPYALYSSSSGALDSKLSIADTSKMLAIYAKAQTVQSLSTAVSTKISTTDTAAMLAPYANMVKAMVASNITSLTAATINSALDSKVNLADSGLIYATPTQLKGVKFDTTSLIARVDKKISIADSITKYVTPTQLASKTFDSTAIYRQLALRLNKADTSLLLQKADTATLSNRINLKFNKADTSLLLQKADTTTLSNRINLKANTTDVTSGLALKLDASQRGAASGVASLDANSKVPATQIPVVSFQSANVVASQAAMLGLSSAVVGSIAIRTDVNRNFILSGANPAVLGNWVELAVPTSVTTINGIPGAYVTLTTDEIGEGTTNKYYTDTRARNAISATAPLNYNASTGTLTMTAATASSNGYLSSSDFTTFNNKQNTLVAGTDYATPSGNITGNAANVTGIVSIINGGTGTTTATGALFTLGAEARSNKSTATDLGNTSPSDILYPSQKAVKAYVDIQNANAGVADLSITNAKLAGSISADKLAGSIPASKLVGTDITTVGTITAGVWNGTTIALNKGGTGATTAADARTNLGLAIGTDVLAQRTFGTAANNNTADFVAANAGITGATKTKLTFDTKGLVTAGADATTADIAPSTDRNYVTDAQKAGVLSNTSGINTGDETTATIKTKLGISTLSGSNTGDQTITLTGDVTGTGSGTFTSTLANTTVTAASYGSSTAIPTFTVDAKGRLTAAGSTSLIASAGTLTGTTLASTITGSSLTSIGTLTSGSVPYSLLSGTVPTWNQNTTGNATTATTAGNITATSNTTLTSLSNLNTVGTIISGTWSGTEIAIAKGGTGATTQSGARSNLGLAIGSDVLAYRTFGTAANNNTADFVAANASITGATKTKLTYDAKGLVTAGADATTADIAPSTDRNYVTDAQKAGVLSNTSGTNTGDETTSTIKTKLGITTLSGSNTGDQTITLIGDLTGTGTGSFAATLTNTAVTAGAYGSSTAIPTFTVDSKGRLTAASTVGITAGVSSLNYTTTTSYAAGGTISGTSLTLTAADGSNPGLISTGAQTISGAKTFNSNIIGNLTGNATTATTAGNITATTNTTLTSLSNLNTVGTITFGTWSASTIDIAHGGTGLTSVGSSGQVLSSNGTSIAWTNPAATGITSINGITSGTQTLTVGTSGTAPAFSSASSTHTLNIPLASATSVTAGLLSKSDYDVFNAKQTALTAGSGISISGGTISATGLTTSNLSSTANISNSQLANSSTILGSTTMILGGTVTSVTGLTSLSATNLSGALTGNASTATALASGRTISTTGDITYTSGSFDGSANVTGTATLTNTAVTAGSYGSSTAIPTFTVDSKGRLTAASTVGITAGVSSLNYTTTTSYAAGGTISGTSLTLAAADGSNPGLISTGAQTIAGAKTFNSNIIGNLTGNASTATTLATARNINGTAFNGSADITIVADAGTLSGTTLKSTVTNSSLTGVGTITSGTWNGSTLAVAYGGTGATTTAAARTNLGLGSAAISSTSDFEVPLTFSSPLSRTTNTISIPAATSSVNGYLTSTDWSTFNAKQAALTAGSGVTISSNIVSVGQSVTTSSSPTFAGETLTGTLTGTTANFSGTITASNLSGINTGNQTIALTGDVTGSGTGTFTATVGKINGTSLAALSTGILKNTTSTGVPSIAVAGTDFQAPISLTTTGSSGTATFTSNTLNIPNYTLAGLGGIGLSGLSATAPLSYNSGTGSFSIPAATSSANGYLSSTDWTTFNNKQTALTAGAGSGISISGGTISATGLTTSNLSSTAGITNAQLANSSTILGSTTLTLGGTVTSVTGLSSVSSTGFTGALTGNASTATTLATSRNINGTAFNGSADITIVADAGTLSGTTLKSTVTNSSLTGVGTITSGTWNGSTLAVAYGGTGVTTSTGSGNVVLSTSPTLVTPVIGAATGTSLTLTGVLSAGTSSVTSSTVSGNGTIGGTLGVTGATTLSSTSAHGGAATFSSTVNVTGATTLTTLTASGNSTLTTLSAGATTVSSLIAPTITGGSSTTQSITYKTTTGVGTTGADHIFQVGSNGATEALRITNVGNIGVGTNSPTSKFDVATGTTTNVTGINLSGSINDFLQFNVQNNSTGSQAQSGYAATADNGTATTGFAWMGINNSAFNFPTLYNIGAANDVTYIGSGQDMHIANASQTKSIILSTGKSTTPFFNERMRITSTGNVGIGTASPTSTLEVNGTTRLGGATTIAGAATFTSTVAITTGAGLGKVLTSDANGGATWTYNGGTTSTQTGTYTITLADKYVFYSTTATGVATFTLPAATSNAGKEIIIKNKSAYTLTIQRSGAETIFQENSTIDAVDQKTLTSIKLGIDAANNWVKLVSDGTQWVVFRALF